MTQSIAPKQPRPRVLLVDDEPALTQATRLALRKEPFDIECADSGAAALNMLGQRKFDVVVSDERMPGMPGSELISHVRREHPDVARIILTGQASVEAAVRAINAAEVFRYLIKPCPTEELALTIREALKARDEQMRFKAWKTDVVEKQPEKVLSEFDAAMATAWMGFQPIVRAKTHEIFGYEALLRIDSAGWTGPMSLLKAAHELGRSRQLGRHIRDLIAARAGEAPAGSILFVNVDVEDLSDDVFITGKDNLGRVADRVILELTEHDPLKRIPHLETAITSLRSARYRIALDDLGSGYSGLTSVVLLVPDVVKIDMGLVRGIDCSPTKQTVVRSIVEMGKALGLLTLAEGIETQEECRFVTDVGCDLLQGYLFGKAAREFKKDGS